MNIVYIHSHDTGRYIEPYGYGIQTPNLMKLAREGTLFRQAYCAAPTCSASRSAMLTGMTPHSNGMLGLAHRGFQLHDPTRHLAFYLNEHNYETVLCGIQHEATDAASIGYERILHGNKTSDADGPGNAAAKWDRNNAGKVAAYLSEHKKTSSGRPFFLSFGMSSTHRIFPETHDIDPNYVMPPFPMYDCAVNRADAAAYAASASVMDTCAGIVMNALRENGLEHDTLILYTTDHGIAFPMMKCSLYDSGIGVSLILKFPGNQAAGQAVDALVSQLDLFPTLCDFAGIAKPDWLQGRSLMPLLEGRQSRIREELFAELNFHAAREPIRCIRTERFKLIRRYEDDLRCLPSNMDDAPSKTFMLEAGLLNGAHAREMLFDLYMDPVERINLVDDARYDEIRGNLSMRLEQWMKETDDPLLHGSLVAPAGARVNVKTTLSPGDRQFET
ncbi:MAG: sulfatase [Paenibacillus sp.]|jgi:arylsulfatase A-like enzyme|nr:sulfatase [Paenibacillus sp.]